MAIPRELNLLKITLRNLALYYLFNVNPRMIELFLNTQIVWPSWKSTSNSLVNGMCDHTQSFPFCYNFFILPSWWASLIAQLVKKIHLQCRSHWFYSYVRKIHRRRDRLPTPVFLGFPCGSAGKESDSNVVDLGSIPGFGRSPE